MDVPVVSGRALLDRCAVVGGGRADGEAPLLLVDLRDSPSGPELDRFRVAFTGWPWVVAGIGEPNTWDTPLGRAVDVVLHPGDPALDDLVDTVARQPVATVSTAMLLRSTASAEPHAALVGESAAYSMLQAGSEFVFWRTSRSRRVAPADDTVLQIELVGADMILTLDRPHRHNAIDRRLRGELADALRTAEPGTTVVLRGTGPSFCSGGDLDEFGTFTDPAAAHLVRMTNHPAAALIDLGPTRVRSHVQGACVGGGLELAAFGAIHAQRDAWFQLPEVGLGLLPGSGGTVSLPRKIGRQRAAWLMLTGRRIDVDTAYAWGLVDHIDDSGTPATDEPPLRLRR